MKIRPVGAELFHVDARTDVHNEADSYFSPFAKATRKESKPQAAFFCL